MIYVSLDTETWGKRAGFDLRSIGACIFDPVDGYVAGVDAHEMPESVLRNSFYVACDNPPLINDPFDERDMRYHTHWDETLDCWRTYPLRRDPATVQWWSEQSEEAQAAFANPVDLRDALLRLTEWLEAVTYDARMNVCDSVKPLDRFAGLRIYAHGPQFDLSILEAAYHACDLEAPWNYRTPRDTRTLFDAAGIDDDGDGSFKTFMSSYNIGTAHHAQDDAIAQARCVLAAHNIITDRAQYP